MEASVQPDLAKVDAFKKQIRNFLAYSWSKHLLYSRLNVAIALTGIALGSVVTLLGSTGYGHLAAVFGAVLTVLIGIQTILKLAENGRLWEIKHNEAKGIRDRLTYKMSTERDFQALVDDWLELKKDLLEKMPRSGGLSEQGRANEAQ